MMIWLRTLLAWHPYGRGRCHLLPQNMEVAQGPPLAPCQVLTSSPLIRHVLPQLVATESGGLTYLWAASARQRRHASVTRMRGASIYAPIIPSPSMATSRTVPSRPGTNV
jgi:hypothetical protein